MERLLAKYLPLRAPEDGAGGGGGTPAAPPAGGGTPAQPPAGGSAPPASPGAPAPAAPPAAPKAGDPPAGPYRPEGLPETMFGDDDRATMDKMAKALNGYRTRDASLPSDPNAYREFKVDEFPEAIRPHIASLSKDPLFEAAAKVALEEKVPVGSMQKITAALYQAAAEAGVLEAAIDPAAERAQLLPESAKTLPQAEQERLINQRLEQNENFIKLLSQKGQDGGAPLLDPKVGEHALLMLMDTAAGNHFLEFVRGQMTGVHTARPLGGDGGTGQAGGRAALQAELAKPEMQPQHPAFNKAAHDQLQERYRKTFGE